MASALYSTRMLRTRIRTFSIEARQRGLNELSNALDVLARKLAGRDALSAKALELSHRVGKLDPRNMMNTTGQLDAANFELERIEKALSA